MPSLHFDMTSSRPLRLHVDRGLETHGYPWVPTDQGLNRPFTGGPDLPEDPPTCQSAPPDLTCGPKDMNAAWSASQNSSDSLR
jgi:hypothetical protein